MTWSMDDYEALALALVRDRLRLAMLRDRLQASRGSSALFDMARYATDYVDLLEEACRSIPAET